MGTNTFQTKFPGDIVDSNDPNQYKQGLAQDHVPRNTSGAPADLAGSLGQTIYRWLNVFSQIYTVGDPDNEVTIEESAATLLFKIAGATCGRVTANGIDGTTLEDGSVTPIKLLNHAISDFTANGTVAVPLGVTKIEIEGTGAGGGGGGGGGAGTSLACGGAGAGGNGGSHGRKTVTVTPGEVLTITIGTGGTAGAAGAASADGGAGGAGGNCTVTGTFGTVTFRGGNGGNGGFGDPNAAANAGFGGDPGFGGATSAKGGRGNSGATGAGLTTDNGLGNELKVWNGESTFEFAGGTAGTVGASANYSRGGGGGAGLYGVGGNGGAAAANPAGTGNAGANAGATAYGAAGGGGSGGIADGSNNHAGGAGGTGAGGRVKIWFIKG